MRKPIFFWFAFLLILLVMTSCKSKANLVRSEVITDSIIETVKDTVIQVAKDSSSYEAFLECKDGMINVKSISKTSSGRKLKTPKVTIENNVLKVDCEAEAEKKFFAWKEKFLKSFKVSTIPVITNELTWWQQTQIYIGRLLFIVLLMWILILVLKPKFI